MDFFDDSDESHTDSEISDHDDESCFDGQSAREEDIILRDGLLHHMLPRKNEWTFESFSDRGSEYIGNLKSKIDTNLQSVRTAYNSFDTILLQKAKPEIRQILSSIRKTLYLRDEKQELSSFLCFAAICPDQYFLSFRQWIIEGLGRKFFKDDKLHFTLSEIVVFFRCEVIMMECEILSLGLGK